MGNLCPWVLGDLQSSWLKGTLEGLHCHAGGSLSLEFGESPSGLWVAGRISSLWLEGTSLSLEGLHSYIGGSPSLEFGESPSSGLWVLVIYILRSLYLVLGVSPSSDFGESPSLGFGDLQLLDCEIPVLVVDRIPTLGIRRIFTLLFCGAPSMRLGNLHLQS